VFKGLTPAAQGFGVVRAKVQPVARHQPGLFSRVWNTCLLGSMPPGKMNSWMKSLLRR
jgi:hypothetical protein